MSSAPRPHGGATVAAITIGGGRVWNLILYNPCLNGQLCLGDEKILRLKQVPSLHREITEVLLQHVMLSRGSVVKQTMIGRVHTLGGRCLPPVTLRI